jgi:hypothetical protein
MIADPTFGIETHYYHPCFSEDPGFGTLRIHSACAKTARDHNNGGK